MSELTQLNPYNSRSLSRSASKAFRRAVTGLEAEMRYEKATIEAAAEIQATRADAIAYVGRRGLQDVAMLSQIEASLATLVPMASGRLAAIADMAAIAIGGVVNDTAGKIR